MDILKILSRGTKKSAAQNIPIIPKPSTKKTANPQLYNDPTRGTKRKRTEQALPEQAASDAEEEVDFFAPKDLNKVTSRDEAAHDQNASANATSKQQLEAPALIDDDEVRQILRSHRLKFTLLSNHEEERATKVKKSKKKQKTAATPTKSTKDSKRPLYPQPLTSFTELRSTYNVSARVCSNLAKQGFRLPTEVQLASLPLLLDPSRALSSSAIDLDYNNGIDFLAVAPTGSGKTLTFLIPSINNVLRRRADGATQGDGPSAIIIAPTRELAQQIANEGKKLAQGTGVKIVGMKKGMIIPAEGSSEGNASPEASENKSDNEDGSGESDDEEEDSDSEQKPEKQTTTTKADILVTTPMMLLNFLTKGSKARTLPSVRSLILDEADVLLDPLFRDQTMGIWNACNSRALRVTLWSATMGANIESLVAEQLKPRTSAPLIRLVVGLKDTAVPSIKHKLIYTATEQGKLFALRQLLHPNSSSSSTTTATNNSSSSNTVPEMRLPFLIFAQTIDRATALHNELQYDIPVEAGGSTRIAALHSSMPESARSAVISRFRAGEIWVLVTTDLLMRGIDFHGVNGVINYDVPTSAAAYVHRVGRTGRAGNREGCVAVTLYTTEDVAHLKTIANVIAQSEKQAASGSESGADKAAQIDTAVPKWLMDALPKVGKESKKKLRERGVESRRSVTHTPKSTDGKPHKSGVGAARITSKSAWERRKEHNRRGAIEGSKNRKKIVANAAGAEEDGGRGGGDEWGGLDD